jgi:hypothetical protein
VGRTRTSWLKSSKRAACSCLILYVHVWGVVDASKESGGGTKEKKDEANKKKALGDRRSCAQSLEDLFFLVDIHMVRRSLAH